MAIAPSSFVLRQPSKASGNTQPAPAIQDSTLKPAALIASPRDRNTTASWSVTRTIPTALFGTTARTISCSDRLT